MSRLPVQHRPRSLFPEFGELLAGFPSWANLRPVFDSHVIRLEDELKEGRYEVRAELPGVDPAKDVDITVRDGVLTIKAERTEKKESNGRSEFSYGSFIRAVTLPRVPTRMASRRATTRASSPSRCRSAEANRPRSTSRSSPRNSAYRGGPSAEGSWDRPIHMLKRMLVMSPDGIRNITISRWHFCTGAVIRRGEQSWLVHEDLTERTKASLP